MFTPYFIFILITKRVIQEGEGRTVYQPRPQGFIPYLIGNESYLCF